MTPNGELSAERAVLDQAEARLETIRAEAAAVAAEVRTAGAGGTQQARLERDIRVTNAARRLSRLNIGAQPLVIGRIDQSDGALWRIGRLAVDDEDREPLVVDWRAPAAQPFYQATPLDNRGVVRRRHYEYTRRQLVGMQDELLDIDADSQRLVLVGEGALLAALERRRSGRMADIVATIQREQDEVIRSPLGGALVVQGGPGTGKTAVALHRAAYLIYTHPVPLETTGVLLVGPNPNFLRYVEHVLPSLGEHTVTLATPATLVDGVEVSAEDTLGAARVKGDPRMVEVLSRARALLCRRLREDVEIAHGPTRLVLTVEASRAIIARARRARGSHPARRRLVERLVGEVLVDQKRAALRGLHLAGHVSTEASEIDPEAAAALARDLLRQRDLRRALDRMWPPLSARDVLEALWGNETLLRRAGAGVLSDEEVGALLGRPDPSGWTAADVALIDEARHLLGSSSATVAVGAGESGARAGRGRRPDGEESAQQELIERVLADYIPSCPNCGSELSWSERTRRWDCVTGGCQRSWVPEQVIDPAGQHLFESVLNHLTDGTGRGEDGRDGPLPGADRTFGHVLVDEAQELSPMQWRMLARRCPSRSFTVTGDLAQASGAWAPDSWTEALAPALEGSSVPLSVAELTINYRTPEEVMVLAAEVLGETGTGLQPPRSARQSGVEPYLVPSGPDPRSRLDTAAAAARAFLAEVSDGRVGVIAPTAWVAALREELSDCTSGDDLDAPVTVLDLNGSKGLEFDAVVVVDPAALVGQHARGMAALYVALTRTTRWLCLVGGEDLAVLSGVTRHVEAM